jgi:hypothetical protein
MHVDVIVTRETEALFRALFAEHGIEIQGYQPECSSGGNPAFTVLVDSKEAMIALAELYWG